jgi:hypothetical protein
MVYPTKTDNRWLAYNGLALAASLLYNRFWASSKPTIKVETAAAEAFNEQQAEPAPAALSLRNIVPTPKTAATTGVLLAAGHAATTAGVQPAITVPLLGAPFAAANAGTVPLLGAPFASAAGGAAGAGAGAAGAGAGAAGAAGAAAGEGIFATMYGAASGAAGTAAKFAWSYLPSATTLTLGGLGVLGLAYLAHKYWKGSGVNITNTNTNTNTVNLNFVGLTPGAEVVQTKDKDGTVHVTVKQVPDKKLAELVRKVMLEMRAQKAAQAAAAA